MRKDKLKDICCKLGHLGDSRDGFYTVKLSELIHDMDPLTLESQLTSIIENDEYPEDVRFAAYYGLSIFYRRGENASEYCKLVGKYDSMFPDYPLTSITSSFACRYRYNDTGDSIDLMGALENARKAVLLLKENPGVYQTFAELVVVALDKKEDLPKELLDEAFQMVNRAITLNSGHARYYCTKGRLYYYAGEYTKACSLLEKAIDLEKLNGNDSVLRIAQYYFYLVEIKSKEMIKNLDGKLQQNRQELEEAVKSNDRKSETLFDRLKEESKNFSVALDGVKARYLEFLAFFASIFAFIISSVNIVSKEDTFLNKVAVLLVFGGILNLSFGILRLLIDYSHEKSLYIKTTYIFILSALLIGGGVYMGTAIK